MSETRETKKQTRSISLTATLSIAFGALTVITLLVASSLQLYFNIRSQQEVVTGEQRLIAQGAANEVTTFIQERLGKLESAVEFSDLINASAGAGEQALEQLLGREPSFRQLALLDGQGEVVAEASRLSQAAAKELSKRIESEALAQTGQGERFISPVYIDDETFEPLMVMAIPVVDVFGRNQGTLLAETNLKFMWNLINRLEIGDEGVAYVVDRQGNLLAFGDETRVIAGENLSQLEEVAEFVNREGPEVELEEQGIRIYTGINNTNVVAEHVTLGTPDWAVVTELPVAEAYRDVVANIVIFGAIIIVISVIAAVSGVFMARRLATPVQHLTDTASQVAEGDSKLQAKPEGPTEVRQLASAFNRMTGQLNDLIGSLEDRVVARTQRLEVIADLSGQLVAILDLKQLITEMVNQIKARFGYYHVQVYLLNREKDSLILAGATGQAGQTMVAQSHSIPMGRGMVGRAAQQKDTVLAPNLSRMIAPEVITAKNIESVYQRETDAAFRSQWYHDYIVRTFGNMDELAAGAGPADGKLKLGFVMFDHGEFSVPIVQGAQEAARDLGIDIEIVTPPHANRPDELVAAFDKFIAAQKDGLAVFPQFQSVWPPFFNKAAEADIPVVMVNLTGPDIADWVWFGQDSYQGGFALAIEFKQYLRNSPFKAGEIVVGISGTLESGHVARYDGFKAGLAGTAYSVSELFYSGTIEPEADHDRWVEFIETRPNLIAAVGLTAQAIPVLARVKAEADADWLIAGFDLEKATMEALKNDVAQVAIAQHPYLQGYLPVLALVQKLRQAKPLSDWLLEGWLPNPLLPDTKSEISVPIILEGQVEGVLDVQSDKVNGVDQNDAALLQSLANQVAVGIRNAQQFEQVQQALARAQAVQERYVEQAWNRTRVARRGAGRVQYDLVGATALPEAAVAEARQQVLARKELSVVALNGGQNQTQQALVAPIMLQNVPIGDLQLHGIEPERKWSEGELALIEAVVDQVAQVAESLRLLDDTQERASRERLIGQVSDRLRRAPDMEALMKTAVGELARILGPDRAFVRLGSEAEFGIVNKSGPDNGEPPVEPDAALTDPAVAELSPDISAPTNGNGSELKLNGNE